MSYAMHAQLLVEHEQLTARVMELESAIDHYREALDLGVGMKHWLRLLEVRKRRTAPSVITVQTSAGSQNPAAANNREERDDMRASGQKPCSAEVDPRPETLTSDALAVLRRVIEVANDAAEEALFDELDTEWRITRATLDRLLEALYATGIRKKMSVHAASEVKT